MRYLFILLLLSSCAAESNYLNNTTTAKLYYNNQSGSVAYRLMQMVPLEERINWNKEQPEKNEEDEG